MEYQSFSLKEALTKVRTVGTVAQLQETADHLLSWLEWVYKRKSITDISYRDYKNQINDALAERRKELEEPLPDPKEEKQNSLLAYTSAFSISAFFLVCVLGSWIAYTSFRDTKEGDKSALDAAAKRTIPFKGILKEPDGAAVESKRDVSFSLYNTYTGGAPLYTGSCIGEDGITPNYQGEFTILLGADCGMDPIPADVFEQGSLFLGVRVGQGEELSPRSAISTGGYAQGAAQLGGKTLGTSTSSIPYIDEQSKIRIDADSPILSSTKGTFLIEGEQLLFKTSSEQLGSLVFQPAAGAHSIFATGHVGIGTFKPATALSVVGNEPASAISSFVNTYTNDAIENRVLDLGLGAPVEGTNSSFIHFYAGSTEEEKGTSVGAIRLNNGGVVYETTGADFAEYFEASENDLDLGMLVSLGEEGIHKARPQEAIIGVMSDSAGFVGNARSQRSDRAVLVGLLGQIELVISTLNGRVQTGDPIGASIIPGFGMKSDQKKDIAGYVLKGMDDRSSEQFRNELCPAAYRHLTDENAVPISCGKVVIFLRPQ